MAAVGCHVRTKIALPLFTRNLLIHWRGIDSAIYSIPIARSTSNLKFSIAKSFGSA
jgi:hypothetical protein